MKRVAALIAAAACLAAPAFADACNAAAEAATRAALESAAAAGRRTATVRVTCSGERRAFVLHLSKGASGTAIMVREMKRSDGKAGLAAENRGSGDSSAAKLIRLGE